MLGQFNSIFIVEVNLGIFGSYLIGEIEWGWDNLYFCFLDGEPGMHCLYSLTINVSKTKILDCVLLDLVRQRRKIATI